MAGGCHEEIRGLDIAMNDPFCMRDIQRLGDLRADVQEPGDIEGLPADVILERLAFE